MSKVSYVEGGGKRITSRNTDLLSHGGTVDKTYVGGKLVSIDHHTPDGKTHSHEVCRGLFGPYDGPKKK